MLSMHVRSVVVGDDGVLAGLGDDVHVVEPDRRAEAAVRGRHHRCPRSSPAGSRRSSAASRFPAVTVTVFLSSPTNCDGGRDRRLDDLDRVRAGAQPADLIAAVGRFQDSRRIRIIESGTLCTTAPKKRSEPRNFGDLWSHTGPKFISGNEIPSPPACDRRRESGVECHRFLSRRVDWPSFLLLANQDVLQVALDNAGSDWRLRSETWHRQTGTALSRSQTRLQMGNFATLPTALWKFITGHMTIDA